MKTRLDADKVEIVSIVDAKNDYPFLDWDMVVQYVGNDDSMTVFDLFMFVKLYDEEIGIWEIAIDMVERCYVCGEILLPDDECYSDVTRAMDENSALCDNHSVYDDELDGYICGISV